MSGTDLIVPQNPQAEENVLGAILLTDRVIDNIADIVEPADFYRESHGLIYRAACEMHSTSKPVDAITLADELAKRGKLDEVGGRIRLIELANLVPAAANAPHYAKIVRDTAIKRRLSYAGQEIARLGYEQPGEADDLLALAETELSRVVHATVKTQFSSLNDGLDTLMTEIGNAYESGEPQMGLRTGYKGLDSMLSGLHGGQLVLIAARPGMGKSALAQNIAENVAAREETVGFLSLEMSKREVQIRSISRAAKVDSKKLRQGQMTPEEWERTKKASETVQGLGEHFKIEDNPITTLASLRAQAKRLARQHDLKLLVVDYLQLMVSSQDRENRTQEITTFSRGLKVLARELDIPVIALSQLNRNLEGRTEKRPMLSDLRESGSLEQDADVVVFIYRDDYYNPSADPAEQGIAEIIVAKNRMGPQETVKLAYVKHTTSFNNIATPGVIG